MLRAPGLLLVATCLLGLAGSSASAEAQPGGEILDENDGMFVEEPVMAYSATAAGWDRAAALYAEAPDLERCKAGMLSRESQAAFLSAFNALRALHGLAPVRYNHDADREAADGALIMAANGTLSHDPPPSWKCWSAAGAHAAGSSNLLGGVSSRYLTFENEEDILAEWMIEGDGDEIGHRRWMLDPYLDQTSLGRVVGVLSDGTRVDSAVMKVFDFPGEGQGDYAAPRPVPEFVAWPQGRYPQRYFSPRARFSFSISEDPREMADNSGIDFSGAHVTISDGQHILPVRDQMDDNEGFGVANCLSWRADGIVSGPTYSVTISGVRGAPRQSYSYTFTIDG